MFWFETKIDVSSRLPLALQLLTVMDTNFSLQYQHIFWSWQVVKRKKIISYGYFLDASNIIIDVNGKRMNLYICLQAKLMINEWLLRQSNCLDFRVYFEFEGTFCTLNFMFNNDLLVHKIGLQFISSFAFESHLI